MNERSGPPENAPGEAKLTLERMRADVATILMIEPAEIGDDDDLLELGLDSIRLMSLALQWNEAGARLSFADFAERPVLRRWWELVSRTAADPDGTLTARQEPAR